MTTLLHENDKDRSDRPATRPRPRPRAREVLKRSWTIRIVAIAAAGLLAGLAVGASMLATLTDVSEDQQQLAGHTYPALEALNEVQVAALDAQAAFEGIAHAATDAEKGSLIAAAQESRAGMDRAWDAYERHAIGTPGERALRAAFLEALGRGNDLGVALVSTPATSPGYAALLAAERAAVAEQRAALDQIVSTIYSPMASEAVEHVIADLEESRQRMLLVAGAGAACYAVVAFVVGRGLRRDQRAMIAASRRMQAVGDQIEFEATLQRGLEMAHSEQAVFTVAGRALESVDQVDEVEVLMTGGRGSRMQRALAVGGGEGCGCCDASECPAAASGQLTIAEDSRAVDACPFLDRGDGPAVWAVCIPVSYAGTAAGVIHAQGDAGGARPEMLVQRLQILARRMGERVGGLRLLRQSEQQARTDPLTGLSNRRSLGIAVQEALVPGISEYTVAFADLDHFKILNDVAGHDTGDRALRLFARVLRDATRPGDLVARYGGEEFLVVFPDCGLAEATAAAERIRVELAAALQQSDVPAFTATIGLASARRTDSFEDVVKRADAALLLGKERGRDQVVAGDLTGEPAPAALVPELQRS